MTDYADLTLYIAKSIADDKDAVSVRVKPGGRQTVVEVTYNVRGPTELSVTTREMYGSKFTIPWPRVSNVELPEKLGHDAPGGHEGAGTFGCVEWVSMSVS